MSHVFRLWAYTSGWALVDVSTFLKENRIERHFTEKMKQQKCIITVKDEVFCFLSGLRPSTLEFLEKKFAVFVEGYYWMPAFKLGRWDGKKKFFEKTGKTYIRFLPEILEILIEENYNVELIDQRKAFQNPSGRSHKDQFKEFGVELRPYQTDAVNILLDEGSGFIIAGTGAGKSLICASLTDIYGQAGYKTITVVPSSDLVSQTADWYKVCGMDAGEYSGSKKEIDCQHVVATWQSLQNNPKLMGFFQMVMVDECFTGDSLVRTTNGVKPINEIKIGDKIVSMNELGDFVEDEVNDVYVNMKKSQQDTLLKLTFDNGKIIKVTENHEFYLNNGEKIKAKDLTENHELQEFDINKFIQSHEVKGNVSF